MSNISAFDNFNNDDLLDLKREIEDGKVVLYLGAGFTAGIKNSLGKEIPSGNKLADLMNNYIKYKGEEGYKEPYNLQTVSESYFNQIQTDTNIANQFFEDTFRISQLPIEYEVLKSFKWNNIYTTNYDNLIELTYEDSPLNVISYKFDHNQFFSIREDILNLIYLNGTYKINARLEQNKLITDIVISETDHYNENSYWEHFLSDFQNKTVLLIGTEIDEPFLKRLLHNSPINNRSKKYLVKGTKTQKLIDFCNDNNIIHLSGHTNHFLSWLKEVIYPQSYHTENYQVITNQYWESIKEENEKLEDSKLLEYYTNIKTKYTPNIIQSGTYVKQNYIYFENKKNQKEEIPIEFISRINSNSNTIFWLNAYGGSGKTTFIYQLAKNYCSDNSIIIIKDISNIDNNFKLPDIEIIEKKPILILLDNYGNVFNDSLIILCKKLQEKYYKTGFNLILTERFQNSNFNEDFHDFKRHINSFFDYYYDCFFQSTVEFYKQLYKIILSKFNLTDYKDSHNRFVDIESKLPTAIRVYYLLKRHKKEGKVNFKFDWEDWESLSKSDKLIGYRNLYFVVSAFNKYDINPPIDFCNDILDVKLNTINTKLLFSNEFPIIISNDKFELRSPVLSEIYFKENPQYDDKIEDVFKSFLLDLNTKSKMYLFRNTYRNKKVLKDKILSNYLPKSYIESINLFEDFLCKKDNCEIDIFKTRMELAILYSKEKSEESLNKAYDHLKQIRNSDPNDIHATTFLATLYLDDKADRTNELSVLINDLLKKDSINKHILNLLLKFNRKQKKETVITLFENELLKMDLKSENNFPVLKYIYSILEKSYRNIDNYKSKFYIDRLLEINPFDNYANNALAIFYKSTDNNFEAIEVLEKIINDYPFIPHNYNELARVYVKLYNLNKISNYKYRNLALKTFIKGKVRLSRMNIPLMTEYSKFLIRENIYLEKAEKYLLLNINYNRFHFQSYSELAILYKKTDIMKAIKFLKESISFFEENSKREYDDFSALYNLLGFIFIELGEVYYEEAKILFDKSLNIKKSITSYKGLAIILYNQNYLINHDGVVRIILKLKNNSVVLRELKEFYLEKNDLIRIDRLGNTYDVKSVLIENTKLIQEVINEVKKCTIITDSLEKDYNNAMNLCHESLNLNIENLQTYFQLTDLNYSFSVLSNGVNKTKFQIRYRKALNYLYKMDSNNAYCLILVLKHIIFIKQYRLARVLLDSFEINEKNKSTYLSIINSKLNQEKSIHIDKIGFFVDSKIINSDNRTEYNLVEKTKLHYRCKSEKYSKVYFDLIDNNGISFADNIEPFFEFINNDVDLALDQFDLNTEFGSLDDYFSKFN